MSPIEQARTLIAGMLKEGPHNAADVLAAADSAGISERTAQRAATALGVVKTRGAFDGGWSWRLPVDGDLAPEADVKIRSRVVELQADMTAPEHSRAEVIAARLVKLEAMRGHKAAPIHSRDPRLLRWVADGISDPDLREAYDRAVSDMRVSQPLTVGLLDRYVAEVLGEADQQMQSGAIRNFRTTQKVGAGEARA